MKKIISILVLVIILGNIKIANAQGFVLNNIIPNPLFPYSNNSLINKVRFYFENPNFEEVTISIYKSNDGDSPYTLIRSSIPREGENVMVWDGKDSDGNLQSPGFYKYQIETTETSPIEGIIMIAKSGDIDHYRVYIGVDSQIDEVILGEGFNVRIIAEDINNETVIVSSTPYTALEPDYANADFPSQISISAVLADVDSILASDTLSVTDVSIDSGTVNVLEVYNTVENIKIKVRDDKGKVGTSETIKIIFSKIQQEEREITIQGGEKGHINPSKGEKAKIYYKATEVGEVTVRIYTLRGQLVWKKTLSTDGNQDFMEWACNNSRGSIVSSGIYIVNVEGPGINQNKKIAIVR